jgi:hypothetical protein
MSLKKYIFVMSGCLTFVLLVFLLLSLKGFPASKVLKVGSELLSKLGFDSASFSVNRSCAVGHLGSQRLILSLEDDFNLGWLYFRVFNLHSPFLRGFSFSNYDDLKVVHDSLPCGLGGVHISASVIYSDIDFEKLRARISKDFSVTVNLDGRDKILKPVVSYDMPVPGGINHNLITTINKECCSKFQDSIRGDFVFGPRLDDFDIVNIDSLNDPLAEFADSLYTPVFVQKHFGLERSNIHQENNLADSHNERVIVNRTETSLSDEWDKLSQRATENVLSGVMVSHAYISGDIPLVPLTFSNRIIGYQDGNKNVFTVSDSLDMPDIYHPWRDATQVTTDFALWVNFYSSFEFVQRFADPNVGSSHVAKILDVKARLKLIELN